MKNKTNYSLSQIEDDPKQYHILEKLAQDAVREALKGSYEKSLPITYLEGETIIKDVCGKKTVIGRVPNNRLKVEVGEKATLFKT